MRDILLEAVLNKFDPGSFLISILPILGLVFVFYIMRKKNQEDQNKEAHRFGRRGRKDHLWLILKEYLRKEYGIGYRIDVSHAFERPHPKDLRDYLVKGFIFKAKQEAKEQGKKYKKPKIPDRFIAEDYFEALSEETMKVNESQYDTNLKPKRELIKKYKDIKEYRRKRYVIVFKASRENEATDWKCIEVEIFKKPVKEGKNKEIVVVNKELDFWMESSWIAPLLAEKEKEAAKALAKKQKKPLFSWKRKSSSPK